jgi:hypothetical protein
LRSSFLPTAVSCRRAAGVEPKRDSRARVV